MPAKNVRVYAQCMKDSNGGVTLMVLNMDKTSEALLKLPVAGERYSLSSPDIFGQTVLLNGKELRAGPMERFRSIHGEAIKAGHNQVRALDHYVRRDALGRQSKLRPVRTNTG